MEGRVGCVDVDESLIVEARQDMPPGLTFAKFEARDAYELGFKGEFDVMRSSRSYSGFATGGARCVARALGTPLTVKGCCTTLPQPRQGEQIGNLRTVMWEVGTELRL